MPPFVQTMLERRWLGDKTKQGFYKKEKDAAGKEVRLVLDWKTLEYIPAIRPKIPSLEMAKNAEQLPERLRAIAGRRCPQGQGCALPLAAAERPVELRGGLPAGDRRRCGQRGSRHARRIQLGDGAVRTVGCGRRARDRGAHAECRRAGEPDCRAPAGRGRRRLVSGSRPRVLRREQRRVSPDCRGRGHRADRQVPCGERCGAAESRRVAGGSGRWRGLPGAALEEERDRRRHRAPGDGDASRRGATRCGISRRS